MANKINIELVQSCQAFEFTQVKTQKGLDFFIKGFASIDGVDRHGEEIPADRFNVDAFMANPQLWFNHDLYPTDKGFAPIGTVDRMFIVTVVEESKGKFNLVDTATQSVVDTIT